MGKDIIAQNLLHQRKRKGLTQEQLSESSGVAVRTIQRIENAKVEPHLQTLALLARSLDLEVHELSLIAPAEEVEHDTSHVRKWLSIFHVAPIAGFVIPFANLVVPLLLWVYKRDDHPLFDVHGKAVINFHLTVTIAFVIAVALLVLLFPVGLLLMILTSAYALAMIIWNMQLVMKNKSYRYPLSINFL